MRIIFSFLCIFRNNTTHQARSNPYQIPKNQASAELNYGRFIDDETEIEFILSRVKESANPGATKATDEEKGIPNLPSVEEKANFKPVILVQNTNADYQILDLDLSVILDKNVRKVGIWIPETILDEDINITDKEMTADIYIKLQGHKSTRLVNYIAKIKKDEASGKFMFSKQFVPLAPMFGLNDLTCDIDPEEIQKTIS